jgi:hypothetical protein
MAEINPPAWEQAGSYAAQQDRMALCAMLTPGPAIGPFSPLGGVRPDSNGLAVAAQSTPAMSVKVASGTCWVPATIPLNAGWTCHNNGSRTVTIAAASGSNPRIDLIVAHAYDATDDIGSLSQWNLEAVTGTPASSPVAPAAPTNSIVLAHVAVAAGATSITSGNIADERNWMVALGGILPTTSTQLPASPYPGQAVYCADTGEVLVYQGAIAPNPHTWQSVAAGPGPWIGRQTGSGSWAGSSGLWAPYDQAHGGAAWPNLTFTVPPSGAVWVSLTSGVGNSGTDVAYVGFSVYDPAVGTSGPNYVPFSATDAIGSQAGPFIRATIRIPVTGLTPGKSLYAQPGIFWNIGSPADDGKGILAVEAIP